MIDIWFGVGMPVWKALFRTMWMAVSSIFHIVLWPVVMHWRMFISEAKYLTSQGEERVKARIKRDDATIVSSRSQMIEVCSESSFQPLLQLYLFLPTLLVSFRTFSATVSFDQREKDISFNVSSLQFWSILTSCLSLSWSFTVYQSLKKRGALDFGANPLGRIFLLFSNICQISSRLLAFVLLAYACGDGNFWPAFVFVLIHILIMSFAHFEAKDKESWKKMNMGSAAAAAAAAIFQSVLNGISNLYMNNLILPLPPKEKKKQVKQSNRSFKRQLAVDGTFLVENLAIILFAALRLDVNDVWPLLVFVFLGQLCGTLLKVLYYKFFHIWSSILHMKDFEA